jgi:hypothetical protein
MDARFQQFFNSNRAHALQFSFGYDLESIQGILRNTGFLFDVVVAACFHTKAKLKAVKNSPSENEERSGYQRSAA